MEGDGAEMSGYCQLCGAAHDDSARFCPKCGKPVGAAAPMSYAERYAGTPFGAPGAPPVVPPAAAPKEGVQPLGLVVGIIALVVIVGGAYFAISTGLGGGSVPTTAKVPPVGSIWFGSSFDTSTFELTGQTKTATVGTPIALVGHLPTSVGSGDVNLRVSYNGSVVINQNVSMKGSGNLFGTTLTPMTYAGSYDFAINDLGGNILASGSLTVAP